MSSPLGELDLSWLDQLSPTDQAQMQAALVNHVEGNRLVQYRPHPKQRLFHRAGKTYAERGLVAANQVGKSLAGSAEWAIHACGRYPDWWDGAEFKRAPILWAGGITGESTRDNPQRLLVGPPAVEAAWGTGMIPRDAIVSWDKAHGVANALDNIVVRHGGGGDVQGGLCVISFKAYEKGREKWQGPTVDGVWYDEEPPMDVYSEGMTRTNNGQLGNFTMATLTPLKGMTEILVRLMQEKPAGSMVVSMTLKDALHYTAAQQKAISARYPPHERKARAEGIPMMGSGLIFPVDEADITVQPFQIPAYWKRIIGVDFGADHPTAFAWLAWDTDTDTVYVYDIYRVKGVNLLALHAAALLAKGGRWIPVAWPHDGNNETAAGPALAKQYKDHGVNMRPTNAKFSEAVIHQKGLKAATSVEAGVTEMLTRMQMGRFKVFAHLNDFFEEMRMYHRKDGLIIKLHDDVLSATRYGIMDLRFAKVFTPTKPQMAYEGPRDSEIGL